MGHRCSYQCNREYTRPRFMAGTSAPHKSAFARSTRTKVRPDGTKVPWAVNWTVLAIMNIVFNLYPVMRQRDRRARLRRVGRRSEAYPS